MEGYFIVSIRFELSMGFMSSYSGEMKMKVWAECCGGAMARAARALPSAFSVVDMTAVKES